MIKIPTTQEDINKVTEQRKKAGALAYSAGKLTAGARTFEDRVMTGVRDRRTARGITTLEEGVGTTAGQLATAPADIRARLSEVNPLQTDVITARQTGQTLGTLATLGEVGEAREGTIEDVIGAGTNRILSMADLKRAEAERAGSEAEALLGQINLRETVKKREFDEWEARQKLDLSEREFGLKKAGTGKVTEMIELEMRLRMMLKQG